MLEATGVYWEPLFAILEERGFEVILVAPSYTSGIGVSSATASPSSLSGSIKTNTSAQIRARISAASSYLFLTTQGWIDHRGRDA